MIGRTATRIIGIAETICIFALPSALPAVVVRHDLDLSAYAALAAQEAFAGVAKVRAGIGFGGRTGSGVVVADRWLLTAAHVVWGTSAGAVSVEIGGRRIAVEEIRFPAAWSASPATGLTQGSDLALIRLATDADAAPAAISSNVAAGQVAFLGGFGNTGNGILGAASSPGLYFAMNIIDRLVATADGGRLLATDFDDGTALRNSLNAATARRTYYDAGFSASLLTATVLDTYPPTSQATFAGLPTAADFFPGLAEEFLEGTTASGDSGGPLFVWDMDAGWSVAGTASWGVNPLLPAGFARTDSRYGDVAIFTDLTANSAWIKANIPEPAPAWLLAAALVWVGIGRNRR